jgi:hypothetical protein
MKTLVAGWFSFEQMGATAGDVMTRDLVCEWLKDAGRAFDVALAPPFTGGVDWKSVDPEAYSEVIFVCGPFGNGWPVSEFLHRFSSRRLIGLNLSMLEPVADWNPFDLLLERDSSNCGRPDLAFLCQPRPVPIVGLVLIHPQPEYRERDWHQQANDAIRRLVSSRELAAVSIDTRLDQNSTGLRTACEVESLIARMDVVLTTRLHGTVLALKNGVPAVVLDPVAGGAKILRQTQTIGWPIVFKPESVSDKALQEALEYCLTPEARIEAQRCRRRALDLLRDLPRQVTSSLSLAIESEQG